MRRKRRGGTLGAKSSSLRTGLEEGGERGTPIPPDQQPGSRFKEEGNYYRTKATNYGSVRVWIDFRIGDWNSAWPNPDKKPADRDSLQYYGNSGVYIYNQYEVQIIDANNYSTSNGNIAHENDGRGDDSQVKIDAAVMAQQWWQDKFAGTQPGVPQLARDGRPLLPHDPNDPTYGRYKKVKASECVPGGLYGKTPEASWKNYTKARDAQDRWNTLKIEFWPGNADQKAYIKTWVNTNLVMDQLVDPTGTKWNIKDDPNIQTSGGIYLQSHWGSNVEFRNVNITAPAKQRP